MSGILQSVITSRYGGAAAPSIALVQQKVGTTADGSSPLTVIMDAGITAGNAVIACITFLDTASFNDLPRTAENDAELTEAITSTIAGVKTYIYYVTNVASGQTAVFFSLDLPVRASMSISEWSGLANAAPEDTSTGTGTSDTVSIVPATQDPTSANNLVIGIGGYVFASDDYAAGPSNSFIRLTPTGGASVFQEAGYLIRTADHSAVTSTVNTNDAPPWAGCSASFGGS